MIDLSARRLGGMVLAASDEFFAPADQLLAPEPPVFDPHGYSDRGKVMDGWESRRRRDAGHDWVLVRLGVAGVVREVVVDTSHFRGNFAPGFSLEGCAVDGHPGVAEVQAAAWFPLVERTPLEGDAEQVFPAGAGIRATHVRLRIFPDGGVARLRLRGEALPDLRRVGRLPLDLVASANGGAVLDCSDKFFSSPENLIAIGDSRDMSDGWETKRRRGPGHDWVVLRLAAEGTVARVEIDTTHFKGNHPDTCTLDVRADTGDWLPLLERSPLAPHARHAFDVVDAPPATEARLSIHPDGGVARLRLVGAVTDQGWRAWGTRWLGALDPENAAAELRACCAARRWVDGMLARRPWADADALLADADAVWLEAQPEDWDEAFAAHPRIGDREGSSWSRQEQAGAAGADTATRTALAEANRAYEERFGRVFLIRATGRTAPEILAALRARLGNSPDAELRVAVEEQRQITRLRLEKLLRPAQASTQAARAQPGAR
jgi:allantoicase